MSSATVRLNDRIALTFDTVEGKLIHARTGPGALLTIEGQTHDVRNCAFIPADKLGAVIASLQLIQKQLLGQGATCHDADACQLGQRACPTPAACRIAP